MQYAIVLVGSRFFFARPPASLRSTGAARRCRTTKCTLIAIRSAADGSTTPVVSEVPAVVLDLRALLSSTFAPSSLRAQAARCLFVRAFRRSASSSFAPTRSASRKKTRCRCTPIEAAELKIASMPIGPSEPCSPDAPHPLDLTNMPNRPHEQYWPRKSLALAGGGPRHPTWPRRRE